MNFGAIRINLLSLLIPLLSFSSINGSDGKWDIKIELSKLEYMLHEPVLLDVTLTNNISDTLRTHGLVAPNQLSFHILLMDSNGKEVQYTGPQGLVAWGLGTLLLDSAEHDYNCFNLLELFGSTECNSGYKVSYTRFPFIPKGTYAVAVEYEGELSSELIFNVVEPRGQEVDVLRRVEQASQVWLEANTGPSARVFGDIVRDYPNTVYAEQCYYLSKFFSPEIFTGQISGSDVRRILRREILSYYPDTPRVRALLSSITYGMADDETIALYNELIAENPGTRCAKAASLLRRRMLAKREAD